MAQHDYIVDDAPGASVRADLNSAYAAIVSNNSGVSQPATTYAYQYWADTTTGILKQRDAANSNWVPLFTLAGGNLAQLAGASFTGYINEARGAVAMSATTMNLWEQPNIIDGTGSAVTITNIANAPQAGARRTLYPIVGTIITNGATFAVDGNADYTIATGDALEFEAITASTYKVHVTKKSGESVNVCPIFRANAAAAQSITTGVSTKVTFGTETVDTNSNFVSSRFTPTVKGWYVFNASLRGIATNMTSFTSKFYLNGAEYSTPFSINVSATSATQVQAMADIIYLNGTTDYVEVYALIVGTTPSLHFVSNTACCYFSGSLLRAA